MKNLFKEEKKLAKHWFKNGLKSHKLTQEEKDIYSVKFATHDSLVRKEKGKHVYYPQLKKALHSKNYGY